MRTDELTAAEACRRLGITLDSLYRLVYAARLPARKEGRCWRIPESAVAERLRKRGEPNGTPRG